MILAIHSPPSRAALASPEPGPLFRRLLLSLSSQSAEAWRSATPAKSPEVDRETQDHMMRGT